MAINKAIIVGRLGNDPEVRYVPDGTAVATFGVATNFSYKKGDKTIKGVDWHRVVVWGKLGEVCAEYLNKGRQVYVEGRLKTRSWEKEGHKNYRTEIVATDVQFLGSKNNNNDRNAINTPDAVIVDNGKDNDKPF